MLKMNKAWIGLLILGILSLPAVRAKLESSLLSHVLIELPLLAVGGMLIGRFILERRPRLGRTIEKYGIAALLTALFVFLYWMLPQSLDASLADPVYATAKFISLPVLLGIPLALLGAYAFPIVKGFVVCNLISMLLVLGWLYTTAPIQLCNFYMQSEQEQLGRLMIVLACLAFFYWAMKAMRPAP